MSVAEAMSRPAPRWRILADDLTGALDTAAAFSGQQAVPVFMQAVQADPAAGPASGPAQALATATRDVSASRLARVLEASLPWFAPDADQGYRSFKKVDSLLRGNTFAEIAWLVQHGGFDGVIFAPAYPEQGRFTRQGQHWVGPPQQPDAPTVAQPIALREAFAAVGLPARLVRNIGADDFAQASGLLIPDVVNDADLARLAAWSCAEAATSRRWLWCGSAGLAWALARHGQQAPASTRLLAPNQGTTLVVTASRHPVLREQRLALSHDQRLTLLDLSSEETLSAAAASAHLTQQAQHIVNTLPRPANLVVVGGDTLLTLCEAATTQSLSAHASPRAGWGRATLQGGVWDGVTCYSRSGAFGAPDDLSALLATLTKKEHTL